MLMKCSVSNKGSSSALDTRMNIWEYMRWERKWSKLNGIPLRVSFGLRKNMAFQVITQSTGSMHFTQALFHAEKSQTSIFSPVVCIETDFHI